tara:strand:- start:1823 stop:2119 length:297 start_codon:yes stop_codon:yes gene_type:complete
MSLNDKQLADKIINNKTVHFELQGNIHKKLRALLFLKELSMQKFFRLMSESFVDGDDYINNLVSKRVDEIKSNKLSKLKNIDTKELYDVIEENSPFEK